jgi:hypothetical protein
MYQCCQLLAELSGQSGRKIQLLRKKVLNGLRYFFNAVHFDQIMSKMPFDKRVNFSFFIGTGPIFMATLARLS